MTNPDPDSWTQSALNELSDTLASKNYDYRIDGEFSNFEHAASVAGVETLDVMMTQIGIKLGRLKGAWNKVDFNHETYMDTVKDLAGYAVILYAYLMSQE